MKAIDNMTNKTASPPPSTNAGHVDVDKLNSFLRDFEAGKLNSHFGSAGPASSLVANNDVQVGVVPHVGKFSQTGRLSRSNGPVATCLHDSESNETSRSSGFAPGSSTGSSLTLPSTIHRPERIPCEFSGYSNCQETFPIENFQAWFTHIDDAHLHHNFPQKAICWFCDEFAVNEDDFPSAESDHDERRTFFANRLLHIRNHFIEGTERTIRPDFYLLDHLRDQNLITEELYEKAKQFSELPPEYHLPADMDFGHPPGRHESPTTVIVTKPERPRRDAIKRPKREQRDGPSSTNLDSRSAAENSGPGRPVIVHQDRAREE